MAMRSLAYVSTTVLACECFCRDCSNSLSLPLGRFRTPSVRFLRLALPVFFFSTLSIHVPFLCRPNVAVGLFRPRARSRGWHNDGCTTDFVRLPLLPRPRQLHVANARTRHLACVRCMSPLWALASCCPFGGVHSTSTPLLFAPVSCDFVGTLLGEASKGGRFPKRAPARRRPRRITPSFAFERASFAFPPRVRSSPSLCHSPLCPSICEKR